MKKGLSLICAAGLSLTFATAGFAKGKGKKSEPEWCCMVDGKVATAVGPGAKKMCVKSESEPAATSKGKLVKTMVKGCTLVSGTWQKDGAAPVAAAPTESPVEKAKDAAKGKVDEKAAKAGVTDEKEMIEDAVE